MAARAQLVEEIIKPALEQKKFVVSDRYLLANIAYQGHARGLDIESLYDIGRCATQGIMPDLTIFLDIPLDVSAARINRPLDRMERMGDEFHTRVREGFLSEAAKEHSKIVVINATGSIDEVQDIIRKIIQNYSVWSQL
jgi:dTMP kinase